VYEAGVTLTTEDYRRMWVRFYVDLLDIRQAEAERAERNQPGALKKADLEPFDE
jgi:hypothetical protein